MNHRLVNLGDVAEFTNGYAFKASDWGNKGRKIIRIQNLTDSTKPFNRTTVQVDERVIVRPGDLLVSWSATLGVYEWQDEEEESLLNQHIFKVTENQGVVEKNYLRHKLQQILQGITSRLHGSTMLHVNRGDLLSTRLELPPLAEQKRIATILDKADEIQKKRGMAIQKLDQLAESVFIEMFGDPVANPMGWNKCELNQLLDSAEVFVDGDWVESKDQDPTGDVRLIQLADVGDGNFIDKSRRFLTKDTARRLKCTFLKEGDLLVARMPDPLGRCCLLPSLPMECVTVVDVCVIRPSVSEVNPLWLMHCINSSGFRSLISAEATGSTRVRISRGNLSRLQIVTPPISLQREFASRITKINTLKSAVIGSAHTLKLLDGSLRSIVFRNLVT